MAILMGSKDLLVSERHTVHFAGWRSNTLSLQAAGWQLSVEESVYNMELRLLMRHPKLRLHAVTNLVERSRLFRDAYAMLEPFDFVVQQMASDANWVIQERVDVDSCYPIDARTQVVEVKANKWGDLPIFAPISVPESKEIIVEPHEVQRYLDAILKSQQPKQAELREKARKSNAARQVHAQILSIA